jgi:hypothetical protein
MQTLADDGIELEHRREFWGRDGGEQIHSTPGQPGLGISSGIGRATNPPGSGAVRLNPSRWLRRCDLPLPEGVRDGTGGGGSSRKKTLCSLVRGARTEKTPRRGPAAVVGSGQVRECAVGPLPVRTCGVAKIS